jgi:NTP pyrophosphatase (non-canonical NTP hydrolase)
MRKNFEEVATLAAKHADLTKDTDNPQTMGSHLQKLSEEFGELAQSVNKISGLKSMKKTDTLKSVNANILEEAADCIQIVFAIAKLAGHSYEDVKAELATKNKSYADFLTKLEKKMLNKKKKK